MLQANPDQGKLLAISFTVFYVFLLTTQQHNNTAHSETVINQVIVVCTVVRINVNDSFRVRICKVTIDIPTVLCQKGLSDISSFLQERQKRDFKK